MEINTENTEPIEQNDGIDPAAEVDPIAELMEEYGDINIIEPYLLPNEVGGLVGETFKLILGNPDVIVTLSVFSIFIALSLTTVEIYKSFR